MQEEIKEILDRLERIDHKEYIAFEFADSATFDEMARCFDERKKMANYITNLQKEVRINNDLIPYFKNNEKSLKKSITNLQEELEEEKRIEEESLKTIQNLEEDNKKLKELCDKYEEEHSTKFNEWVFDKRENERLKLEIERLNDVLVHKPDEKITLKTNDGQELFIIQSERIDMQEELNKANMELMIKLEDYKSRNEKAIEFVNEFIQEDYYEKLDEYITHFTWNTTKEDLLNKLQGVDKE